MTIWDEKMLIGVPEIDEQHRNLVNALNELLAACENGNGQDSILKTFIFIVGYTKVHFADEEELQVKYDYPYLDEHRELHKDFTATVTALLEDFEQDRSTHALIAKTSEMLTDWVVNHICIEDKKIGDHIQKKK